MHKLIIRSLCSILLMLGSAISAHASVITFTGGTVTTVWGGTYITNSHYAIGQVSKYEEAGFRVQLVANGFPYGGYVGDYYNVGDDVLHIHWATGNVGGNVTQVKITKIDGSAFDMNYFVLTTNTGLPGIGVLGTERAYIHASSDGVTDDYSQLLPTEAWGFPATQIFLGSQFDSVKAVWFDAANLVDCFGMDSFYINEAAPGTVPEPASLLLAGTAILGMAFSRRRRIS